MNNQPLDTSTTKPKSKQSFPYGYILLGLLAACIGVCFLTLSNVYTMLAIAMGIVMIIFSLIPFASAFISNKRGLLFVLKIIASVSGIVAGIVTLIVQSGAIYVIANVLYLAMIIDGAYKVGAAIHSHKFYLMRFWVIAALGGFIVVCAFLVSKLDINPSDNSSAIHAILTGGLLIIDGVINILYAFFRRSFLIPEEFLPENKRRIEDTTTEPKVDDEPKEDEPKADDKADGDSTEKEGEAPEQTTTPPKQKRDTILTPPVIEPLDTSTF